MPSRTWVTLANCEGRNKSVFYEGSCAINSHGINTIVSLSCVVWATSLGAGRTLIGAVAYLTLGCNYKKYTHQPQSSLFNCDVNTTAWRAVSSVRIPLVSALWKDNLCVLDVLDSTRLPGSRWHVNYSVNCINKREDIR